MNQYEIYMRKSAECQQKAYDATCLSLRQFYINASFGFMMKAMNLKLSEVTK